MSPPVKQVSDPRRKEIYTSIDFMLQLCLRAYLATVLFAEIRKGHRKLSNTCQQSKASMLNIIPSVRSLKADVYTHTYTHTFQTHLLLVMFLLNPLLIWTFLSVSFLYHLCSSFIVFLFPKSSPYLVSWMLQILQIQLRNLKSQC